MTDRTSAWDRYTLTRDTITSGIIHSNPNHNSKTASPVQATSGNKCGHNKNVFRLPVYPTHHQRRPHVIEEAKRRIIAAQNRPYAYPGLSPVFYHGALKNGRKRRSEGVEAINSLVLSALVHGANLVNYLSYGFYDNQNNFKYLGYDHLCKVTQCTLSRVKRALKVLKNLRLCQIEMQKIPVEGANFTTLGVKIRLTSHIFTLLGLENELNRDYQTAFIKWEKNQLKLAKKYNIKILKKEHVSANFAFVHPKNKCPSIGSTRSLQDILQFTGQKFTNPLSK